MKMKQILARIHELFITGLQTKTGWGRNEVIALHERCVNQALMEAIDDTLNNPQG